MGRQYRSIMGGRRKRVAHPIRGHSVGRAPIMAISLATAAARKIEKPRRYPLKELRRERSRTSDLYSVKGGMRRPVPKRVALTLPDDALEVQRRSAHA